MLIPLRCVLIGSGAQLIACAEELVLRGQQLVGVISDCSEVGAWCGRRQVALAPLREERAFLAREPFDYLFSIVHHAIVSPEVLRLPRLGAINYHDSLLPDLAGFNACAWALLEGRAQHGVTWHEMAPEVDRGRVLLQASFDIAEDDTAFTLSVKCSEKGVETFRALLSRLLERKPGEPLSAAPQKLGGSFHLRSERPDSVLDLDEPGPLLQAKVRALQFGPDDNWMGTAKLWLGCGFVSVGEARFRPGTAPAPGTVISLESGLTLAVNGGALHCTALSALDGSALDERALRERFCLAPGVRLEPWQPGARSATGWNVSELSRPHGCPSWRTTPRPVQSDLSLVRCPRCWRRRATRRARRRC